MVNVKDKQFQIDLKYDFNTQQAYYHHVVEKAQRPWISWLIGPDKKAIKEAVDQYLIDSARAGNLEGLQEALAAGANANVTEVEDGKRHHQTAGATPLMTFCWEAPDCVEGINSLIAAEADVTLRTTESKQNALIALCSGASRYDNAHKDVTASVDAIIAAGAKADDGFPQNGKTPLFACLNGYDSKISASAVKALLKHNANPNAFTTDGQGTILNKMSWVAQQGDALCVEAVKAVVEAGGLVNPPEEAKRSKDDTPLWSVVNGSGANQAILAEYFISKGADTTITSQRGMTITNGEGQTIFEVAEAKMNDFRNRGYIEKDKKTALVEVLEKYKEPASAPATPAPATAAPALTGKGQGGSTPQQVNQQQQQQQQQV